MEARLERLQRFDRILESFSGLRLLVAGDLVLDEYLWGEVERVSSEAPVPVVHLRRESLELGGAGNVVRNIAALGGSSVLCSVVGDDGDGRRVLDLLKDLGVDTQGVEFDEGRPTTRKTRVIAKAQQVVRYDRESQEAISASVAQRVRSFIRAASPGVNGVILQDYGKGFFSPGLNRKLMRSLEEAELPVAVDPKLDLASFRGAALLKPNLREAQALSGIKLQRPEDLDRIASLMRRRTGARAIAITRGPEGVSLFEEGRPAQHVPTAVQEIFDVQGAGDTSIAAMMLALQAGATFFEAAILANAAAAVVVAKVGTATAGRDELRELLPAVLDAAEGLE